MKKFEFRLQGILEIKEKLENQAKMAFAVAQAKLVSEQEKLEALITRKEGYEDKLRDLMSSRLELQKIRQCEDAIEVMKERINEQQLAVKRAEKQVELARIKLSEAMIEKKTIETLREKALENYMKEFNADEQKQIDGLVSYRYTQEDDE